MDEQLSTSAEYSDSPADTNREPITGEQRERFAKLVNHWSVEPDGSMVSDASEARTTAFMADTAKHRAVTELVRARTRSRSGMQYEREGVTVTCKAADDFASLGVQRRVPTADPKLDKVTSSEYFIDGPDEGVMERAWFVDVATGKRAEAPELDEEVEAMLTFGREHDADITLTEDHAEERFTQGRFKEADALFAQLDEESWTRTVPGGAQSAIGAAAITSEDLPGRQ